MLTSSRPSSSICSCVPLDLCVKSNRLFVGPLQRARGPRSGKPDGAMFHPSPPLQTPRNPRPPLFSAPRVRASRVTKDASDAEARCDRTRRTRAARAARTETAPAPARGASAKIIHSWRAGACAACVLGRTTCENGWSVPPTSTTECASLNISAKCTAGLSITNWRESVSSSGTRKVCRREKLRALSHHLDERLAAARGAQNDSPVLRFQPERRVNNAMYPRAPSRSVARAPCSRWSVS